MHPSELEFAAILDFYNIKYLYEPRSFTLRWDGNRVAEMFTPDFYLPELDQYVELTTMKQNLVTQKNRKLRHLREVYPDVNVILLYRRDYQRLLAKYGYGPLAEAEVHGIDRVLFNTQEIAQRVKKMGEQISEDYEGQEPVLLGVLRGVVPFLSDLMREISVPVDYDLLAVSHFAGEIRDGTEAAVQVTRDIEVEIEGRPVILVEDIVDTGMTLRYLLQYLWSKKPTSLVVCTLLDKQVRRIADVPIKYRGFEIPDEFVVGYGLDHQGRHRNLPFIGVLKPVEPKQGAQR